MSLLLLRLSKLVKMHVFSACRVGVDLTVDDPQKQVMMEMKIVQGIQRVLGDTVALTTEQVRILRKTAFNLNKELRDKDRALEIDTYAKGLNVHRSEVQAHCLTEIVDVRYDKLLFNSKLILIYCTCLMCQQCKRIGLGRANCKK